MLNYIETGQRTEIFTDGAPPNSVAATLSRISPFLHPVTHSTDAEIDLANTDRRLKPGMFVATEIYYGESESATLVPLSALYENPATGATGIYVSQDSLNLEATGTMADGQALTAPVRFEFVPVEVIARGRMEAGVRGVAPGNWVVTIGKDLFGGESGTARVRPVHWEWVQQLQHLQRDDLLQEVLKRQQEAAEDSTRSQDPA
jgi:multidrug efflux pump subunit AcrA (membrane-fusion protein)